MNIGLPRYLAIVVAALFSGFHIVLGLYALDTDSSTVPAIVAMVLFAGATTASLLPGPSMRLRLSLAVLDLAVAIAVPLLVSSAVDPTRPGGVGYAVWDIAAVGTLLTIVTIRLRPAFAWLGIAFLLVHTAVWAGPGAIVTLGAGGSLSWVAVAYILSRAMKTATKDARRFALAEREAAEWQAAQEAHVFERQFRLGQTSSMALEMLRRIESSGGELTDAERRECLHLEGAIRDEIRGRRLLNDEVRAQVMRARRRGATVSLLDEGGLDELNDRDRARLLGRLADAIGDTDADKLIARTVPEESDIAITVVGLRTTGDEERALLDAGSEDDEVVLWLEIRRDGR